MYARSLKEKELAELGEDVAGMKALEKDYSNEFGILKSITTENVTMTSQEMQENEIEFDDLNVASFLISENYSKSTSIH